MSDITGDGLSGNPILGQRIDQMVHRGQRLQLTTQWIATENVCVVVVTLCCTHLLVLKSNWSSSNDAYDSVNNFMDTEADMLVYNVIRSATC
jgi:hypothetical protein